jgi:hypothetical protein
MTQSVSSDPQSLAGEELLHWFMTHLRAEIDRRGYRLIEKDEQTDEGGIVLYPVAPSGPRSFRRKNRAVFVVGIDDAETYPEVPLKTGYPMLLRTLANLFIMICEKGRLGSPEAYFFTLEQGYYAIPYQGDPDSFISQVVDRLVPLATSQLMRSPNRSPAPASTSTISICSRRPSRSRTTSRRRISATSRAFSRWAVSPMAT